MFQEICEKLGCEWNLTSSNRMHFPAHLSLKVEGKSVFRRYYAQRERHYNREAWHIKHIFFEDNPKLEEVDAVEKVNVAFLTPNDIVLLVTAFPNMTMHIALKSGRVESNRKRVSTMRAISERVAESRGVIKK